MTLGESVLQKVDWSRRFDHMQQHSGQHLISAMFDKLNLETLSWWMAENPDGKVGVSFIELDTDNVAQEVLDQVEKSCNDAIMDHVNVETLVYQAGSKELEDAKTRGLPDDVTGAVRVIKMGDLDSNMCCGTHVRNLSQLQVVKLLNCEKSKRKGKCNVYFLVGNRVTEYFKLCFTRERDLTAVLNGGPEYHSSLADKAVKNARKYQKSTQNLMKEVATSIAKDLKETKPKFYSVHRMESEMDFCNTLLSELQHEKMTVLITMGNDKEGTCSLVLQSFSEEIMKDIGKKLMEILEAKGGGKGLRLNGKFTSLNKRNDVDKFLKEYFETK